AEGGLGNGAQAGPGDGLAAALAHAVGALLDLLQGPVDLLDLGPGLGRQGQVALTLDVHRAALARLLVELDVARLHLPGQLVGLGLERLGLLRIRGPLREKERALLLEELVRYRALGLSGHGVRALGRGR